jgi:hypothetical protein
MADPNALENPAFAAQAGKGRPRGPNKIPAQVKEMILEAVQRKGGVEYFVEQAEKNPRAFLALVAKIIPLQVVGEGEGPLSIQVVTGVPRAGSDG